MNISPHLHFKLGDLQLRILQLLWQRGEMPAAGVHAALQPERSLAPTTIATMLAKMEARGLITHREQGRAFIYRAAVDAGEVTRGLGDYFVQRLFAGNVAGAVDAFAAHRRSQPARVGPIGKTHQRGKKEGQMSLVTWARWLAWLAAETTALVAVAAILHLWFRSPRAGRTLWRAGLTAVALVWIVELSGLRERMAWPGFETEPFCHHGHVVDLARATG